MKRRDFLRQAALLGGALSLPFPRGWARAAGPSAAAGTAPVPYPVLQIFLRGGADPAMHFTGATGNVGNVTLANRPSSGFVTEPKTGIVYYSGCITPSGQTDFQPFIPELAVVRAMEMEGQDHIDDRSALWFGSSSSKQSWANVLASNLRTRSRVLKPVGVAYPDGSYAPDNFVEYSNTSPDPAAAAERVLSVGSWHESLSSGSLFPYAQLAPGLSFTKSLDQGTYNSATQPDVTGFSQQATANSDSLLQVATTPVWPPPASVLSALGLSASDVSDTTHGMPTNRAMVAGCYQALAHNVSHVLTFEVENYDSHTDNISQTVGASSALFPMLGKLFALMKKTASPLVAGKSLYDTTNIWIQSEMGRSPGVDTKNGSTGTDHWAHTHAVFLGGRFVRGKAIGAFDANWRSAPVDPATGATGSGQILQLGNLLATVFKAAGADPTLFTPAAPIDALLDPTA